MLELLATLTPIALVDSLSVVPVALVPMLMLLGGRRPLAGAFAFIAGILFTYLPFGLLLLFGLDYLFDTLAAHFSTWWNREPHFGEVVLELVVGLLLMLLGNQLCNRGGMSRAAETKDKRKRGMTPLQAFGLAAMLNAAGLWGALPYFAAIAQILKEGWSTGLNVAALAYYNLVFILPLLAFPLLHLLMGPRAQPLFRSFDRFIRHWSRRLLAIVFIGLGFLLLVDAIGWLNGTPLLPPNDPRTTIPR